MAKKQKKLIITEPIAKKSKESFGNFIDGFIFSEIPAGGLNMQGQGEKINGFPSTEIKSFKYRGRNIPIISGQAWKYMIRTKLQSLGWTLSKTYKDSGKSEVYTDCDPIQYIDDDLFGYMHATKKKTRIAPFKVSYLVGYLAGTKSFMSSFSRNKEEKPAPFYTEVSYGGFGGIFSIDLFNCGRFYSESAAGYKNFGDDSVDPDGKILAKSDDYPNTFILTDETTRKNRVKAILNCLGSFHGGANQTLIHNTISPKFLILMVKKGGNNILGNFISLNNPSLPDPALLKELVLDYQSEIMTNIYIGIRKNILPNESEWKKLNETLLFNDSKYKFRVSTPIEALKKFSEEIDEIPNIFDKN